MAKRKLPKNRNNQVNLSPEQAIAIIGVFSAAVDGNISDAEMDSLGEFLSEVSLFEDYSEEDFEELAENIEALFEEQEPEDLITSAIESLPNEDYREAALITAILVVGIDGKVPEDEEGYIVELQQTLNISDERTQEIIDEIFGEDEEEEE